MLWILFQKLKIGFRYLSTRCSFEFINMRFHLGIARKNTNTNIIFSHTFFYAKIFFQDMEVMWTSNRKISSFIFANRNPFFIQKKKKEPNLRMKNYHFESPISSCLLKNELRKKRNFYLFIQFYFLLESWKTVFNRRRHLIFISINIKRNGYFKRAER